MSRKSLIKSAMKTTSRKKEVSSVLARMSSDPQPHKGRPYRRTRKSPKFNRGFGPKNFPKHPRSIEYGRVTKGDSIV